MGGLSFKVKWEMLVQFEQLLMGMNKELHEDDAAYRSRMQLLELPSADWTGFSSVELLNYSKAQTTTEKISQTIASREGVHYIAVFVFTNKDAMMVMAHP